MSNGIHGANMSGLVGAKVDYDNDEGDRGSGHVVGWFIANSDDTSAIVLCIVDGGSGEIVGMKMRHVTVTAAARRRST